MNNIKVVDKELIENQTITNHSQNENSYIVVYTENGEKYVDCFLLNIDVKDYLTDDIKDWIGGGTFCLLKNFDLKYINGFLYISEWMFGDEIYLLLENYGECFIKGLENDALALYASLFDEVERLEELQVL